VRANLNQAALHPDLIPFEPAGFILGPDGPARYQVKAITVLGAGDATAVEAAEAQVSCPMRAASAEGQNLPLVTGEDQRLPVQLDWCHLIRACQLSGPHYHKTVRVGLMPHET
jgi:hypothetical protein